MRVSTAVKVAIRQYFACARGFEQQVYDLLMGTNLTVDIQTVDFCGIDSNIHVYYPYENFTVETLLNCVDSLIDDIIAETIGEK
jgi:hypothetical protein